MGVSDQNIDLAILDRLSRPELAAINADLVWEAAIVGVAPEAVARWLLLRATTDPALLARLLDVPPGRAERMVAERAAQDRPPR
jgi:hypothetical protein